MAEIVWSTTRPPARPHVYPILSPRPGDNLHAIILCDRPTGVWTHFLDGRSAPHVEPVEDCLGCKLHKQRPRLKGYVSAYLPGNSRVAILELTESIMISEERFTDAKAKLRGWHVALRRMNNVKRGRVSIEWVKRTDLTSLPPAIDVKASLAVVWGLQLNLPGINTN